MTTRFDVAYDGGTSRAATKSNGLAYASTGGGMKTPADTAQGVVLHFTRLPNPVADLSQPHHGGAYPQHGRTRTKKNGEGGKGRGLRGRKVLSNLSRL